jgi:hypothetical protein
MRIVKRKAAKAPESIEAFQVVAPRKSRRRLGAVRRLVRVEDVATVEGARTAPPG